MSYALNFSHLCFEIDAAEAILGKKKIFNAMTDGIRPYLKVKQASRLEHLRFNMLDFLYFKDSKGIHPLIAKSFRLLFPLMIVPYALGAEIAYFQRRRYFVNLGRQTVGIFALHEEPAALYISNIAVAPEYRRHGIARYMLSLSIQIAKKLKKTSLELSVLKANAPALRLYREFGFTLKEERKWAFVLAKTL
jgi:ribosomal protein S18 acetylase RimI-like enzyme